MGWRCRDGADTLADMRVSYVVMPGFKAEPVLNRFEP